MALLKPDKKKEKIQQKQICSTALEAFFNICSLWKLSTKQQEILLGLSESTFFKYKKDKNVILHRDTLERISYIVGIYKALNVLFPDSERADKWIKKPNNAPLFKGEPALNFMLRGNVLDLALVRNYLDAQRGW